MRPAAPATQEKTQVPSRTETHAAEARQAELQQLDTAPSGPDTLTAADAPPPPGNTVAEDQAGRRNMHQLIQLRWIAVVGQIATIAAVHLGFGIRLPLEGMWAVLAFLVAFNIASLLRERRPRPVVGDGELFMALLVDVGTLTAQLYLSGGASNPFAFLYLLQVALGAVLLRPRYTRALVAITCLCFIGLTIFHRPLALPEDLNGLDSPYVQGLLLCFALNAALLVIFITRIGRNLRTRDARLAALRQRAAEEEHIVRMGLLASGAAHELGTPLATVSVILGDWRRMPRLAKHPEMLQEIDEMQSQLKRCKDILTGILLASGETRGEAPTPTTVGAFIDGLVAQWRATRPAGAFDYDNRFGQDMPIVSDTALQQMICNVLDNAREASPQWVGLEVLHDGDTLVLKVADAGPGFADGMLAKLGKPYQSSKGQPGRGLGLFLSFNVARTLGGNVTAANRPQGGAVVTMSLPLSAITLPPDAIPEPERHGQH